MQPVQQVQQVNRGRHRPCPGAGRRWRRKSFARRSFLPFPAGGICATKNALRRFGRASPRPGLWRTAAMRKPHLLLLLLAASLLAAVWAVGTSSRAPRSETPPGCPALAGEVRDADGPVAGARVRVKGEGDSVLADAVGRFQLPWPADGGDQPRRSPGRVTAWKEGYFIGGAAVGRLPLQIG